jgi:adenylate cyclase
MEMVHRCKKNFLENKYKMRRLLAIRFPKVSRWRLQSVIFITLFWTAIDLVIALMSDERQVHPNSIWFREGLIFLISFFMGYLFVFHLKKILRQYPLWISFLLKSFLLLFAAFLLTFVLQFLNAVLVLQETPTVAIRAIRDYVLHRNWLLQKVVYWITIFFVTQLILLINEKYSPGVFFDILTGKYIHPKVENRIVMFIDLKDSTPIAEKLGHQLYFNFIREFIYHVSMAILEYQGTIYQYVGDEVVCSWKNNEKNTKKCLDSIIQARKNIHRKGRLFKKAFGIIPEFRVGINVGEVTIGEIGVIKKDLAMSGDTMNTTARIRSACNELNHHFIVSKDFIEAGNFKDFQAESLGMIDLKGKKDEIELFSLNI